MAVGDATKWFTQQGGDPATGFVSGADGVQSITQVYSDMSVADDALVPKATVGNLLLANLANGSESGSLTGLGYYGGSNAPYQATIASSTAQKKSGSRSIALTATATYSFFTLANIAVTEGQTYTIASQVLPDQSSGETFRYQIVWLDGGGATLSTSVQTPNLATSSAAWANAVFTAVAPTGAVNATVFLMRNGSASAVTYFDEIGFWQGAGGLWALPGTPIANLGFYTDESVGRRLFQWDANNARFQQTFGDTGVRDVSALLVNSWTTTGAVHLARTGNLVTLTFYGNLVGTSATSAYFMTTIPGFRGAGGNSFGVFVASDNSARMAYFDLTDGWAIDGFGNATYKQATFTYRTPDAWPSSLPGTAVGSIPNA